MVDEVKTCVDAKINFFEEYFSVPDDLKSEISSKTGDKPSVENDTEYIHNKKGNFTFTVLSEKVPNSVYGTITLAKCGKMMWDEITNNWS